jgi:hypothetical protein
MKFLVKEGISDEGWKRTATCFSARCVEDTMSMRSLSCFCGGGPVAQSDPARTSAGNSPESLLGGRVVAKKKAAGKKAAKAPAKKAAKKAAKKGAKKASRKK